MATFQRTRRNRRRHNRNARYRRPQGRPRFEALENRELFAADDVMGIIVAHDSSTNPVDSQDVNGDGCFTPIDILQLVNVLRHNGGGPLPLDGEGEWS